MPKLDTLRFYEWYACDHPDLSAHSDRIEDSDSSIFGSIRSIKHGDGELLHVRLALSHEEINDKVWVRPARNMPWSESDIVYTVEDGTMRVKEFKLLEKLE